MCNNNNMSKGIALAKKQAHLIIMHSLDFKTKVVQSKWLVKFEI